MQTISAQDLAEQATKLGEQELKCLQKKQVEQAASLAKKRSDIMKLINLDTNIQDRDGLREKLVRLQSLQGYLTQEAKKLRDLLKGELMRARTENRRFTGYRNAAVVTPITSHYISKRG